MDIMETLCTSTCRGKAELIKIYVGKLPYQREQVGGLGLT